MKMENWLVKEFSNQMKKLEFGKNGMKMDN